MDWDTLLWLKGNYSAMPTVFRLQELSCCWGKWLNPKVSAPYSRLVLRKPLARPGSECRAHVCGQRPSLLAFSLRHTQGSKWANSPALLSAPEGKGGSVFTWHVVTLYLVLCSTLGAAAPVRQRQTESRLPGLTASVT